MNLKRSIFALAALILGVGFFGASPANAFVGTPQTQGDPNGGLTVTCYHEQSTIDDINHWPGPNYWYCGTVADEQMFGSHAYDALSTMNASKTGTSGKTVLFDNHVKFFVFHDANAFQTFCKGSVISPKGAQPLIPVADCFANDDNTGLGPHVRGASAVGASFPYTVVVESDIDGPSGKTVDENMPFSFIEYIISHEAGHHEDLYLAPLLGKGVTHVNKSTQFTNALAKDWTAIIALDSHNPVNSRNGCNNVTGSTIFINQQDQNGEFICNNNGAGPLVNISAKAKYTIGMNNQQVLQAAWPLIYKPNSKNPNGLNAELGASIFADSSGKNLAGPRISSTTQEQGKYLKFFACVEKLEQNLQLDGSVLQCP